MTQTKSHNYARDAGFTTASAPSRLSIVVHALKMHDSWRSGPDVSVGGQWNHTHAIVSNWRRRNDRADPGFPPMLWSYNPEASLNGSMLEPLEPRRQAWYHEACHPWRALLKRRAEALVSSVRGPRPKGMKDSAFLGGTSNHWTGHGCHPTRGYPCLLYTSPSPRDRQKSRMPSSA